MIYIWAGECKDVMLGYLSCMKSKKGMNDPECRNLAKSYLSCRMDRYVYHIYYIRGGWLIVVGDRNLMAKDEFKNLGFGEEKPADGKVDEGKKGELRW